MHNVTKRLLFISFIIIIFSGFLYFYQNPYWYYSMIFGVLILFDRLSSLEGNKTTIDLLLRKKYKKFFTLYLLLLLLAIFIEGIGRIILGLWNYPRLPIFIVNIAIILYPVILMSFREMFMFLKSIIENKFISVVASMFMGIMIWEIPNNYSQDWIYKIPFVSVQILDINLVVIIGWIILIMGPLYCYKILKRIYKK
jgi:hypothetical protein